MNSSHNNLDPSFSIDTNAKPVTRFEGSAEELKAHTDFIAQETKGYEVKVFNKKNNSEEKAIIKLMNTGDLLYANRAVYTDTDKRIEGNEFVPKKNIKEEFLRYELLLAGERWGIMGVRILEKHHLFNRPAEDLYIESLNGSNGSYISQIGTNLIKIAIELSHKKGFKGALHLDADGNSPGFYWLAGLSIQRGDDSYYPPKIDKEIVKRVTNKLSSIKDDNQLATDPDCIAAKILLAKQLLKQDFSESDERFESRAKHAAEVISISKLRDQWPKILRTRHLYEVVYMHDNIMDELALARLNLPRFKNHDKDHFEEPDTTKFEGLWVLPATSVEQWEKLVTERHEKLKQHMEKIKRNEIMSENQFLTDDVNLGANKFPFFKKDALGSQIESKPVLGSISSLQSTLKV